MNANELETAIEVLKANEHVQNEINKKLFDLIKEIKDEIASLKQRIQDLEKVISVSLIIHQLR